MDTSMHHLQPLEFSLLQFRPMQLIVRDALGCSWMHLQDGSHTHVAKLL